MSRVRGVTLLELLVVLVLLGLLLAISGVGLASLRRPSASQAQRRWAAGRADAIRTGTPVLVVSDSLVVRFLPDGRALGPGVDPLSGALRAAR